ncbi:unnamed protein product [Coregonus sp. 'balchen']|nr:unnamed protein product [Coregonus sp. 'balchen']
MSETEKVQRDILSLVEQHPEGIPLNKLTVAYSQKYHRNLTLSSLGFSSKSSLVASLDGELCVDGDLVFHRTHRGAAGAPAQAGGDQVNNIPHRPRSGKDPPSRTLTPRAVPLKTPPPSTAPISCGSGSDPLQPAPGSCYGHPPSSGSSIGATCPSIPPSAVPRSSPLLSFSSTVKENEEVTQEELLDRVREVIKVYPPAATTVVQLQNGYFLRFGKPLPLQQYRSLYDNHEKRPAAPCSAVDQGKTGAEKPAATPKKTESEEQSAPSTPLNNGYIRGRVRSKTRSPLLQTTSPIPSSSPLLSQPPVTPQTPQPGTSASDSDFPALNAELRMTKAQERRLLAVGQREGNSPVFREAYQAQLREVHGANVRAVEAQAEAEEEEEEDGMRRRRRKKALDPEAVNSLVEDVIRDIAAEGELVTREKVISRVCRLMQIPSLEAGRIDLRWQIPALNDLQRTLREINMFIESVDAVNATCTLYELGQNLAGLKNKKRFEELNLGPLCKLPLIHRMFKMDSNTKDEDIHQIETVDILRTKPKVDLAEFMKHLSDQYSCDSPYELGIRIHSVGLPIATLQKAVSSEHVCMERAREAIQRELEEEVGERMRKMKRGVMEGAQGPVLFSSFGSAELRKKYVTMTAAEAVLEVFTNASGVFNPKMTKSVQDFMLRVSADRLARALFQLAICGGSLAAPQDLVPKEKPARPTQERRAEEKTQATPPSEAAVKQILKENLSNHSSAFTLGHVASLERKLAKHFQVTEFTSLEQGSFLEFLVKQAQETVGGAVVVGSSSGGGQDWQGQGCGFRPSRQDVFEFIKQCGTTAANEPDGLSHIEWCLRAHYGVRDSRDLGLGPLRTLVGLTVGILGEVSQTQALSCLFSCPLLDELGQWSQWELVFRPRHGPLKDFIDRNAASTDLSALEVSPGVLLRVTTCTGDKLFSQAAMTLDPVGTAGHLVSMVVFLEPFFRVLGGQAKSKAVLLSTARSNLRHLNCLHQLGIVLGITDWVNDYHTKLSAPQNQDLNHSQNQDQTPPADQTKPAPVDSLNRSLSQTLSGWDEDGDEDELYELILETHGDTHTERDGEEDWEEGQSLAEPVKADNADSQSESRVDCHRAIIDDIRKSEFGIGVEMNEEGQRLMTVHQERLGRSLDRLSTELYSKDTHFVLELIQNADDNSYPTEEGPVPALAFVVEKDCVTVLNNETGFQEKNIRAICDVGRSTKGKHKYGYIGQKGIGFKSVFKVTDCPEIHSNGFHLCFDKTSGPHWDHRCHKLGWTTKICLPLRSECYQTKNLFHDVHPSLLLFLHRLRSITIYNQAEKRMVTMTRRDLSHNVLEVEHTEGTERWLVVKHTLHPTKIKDEVESTELALAFQLGDDLTGSDIRAQPQKQPVFAFLPLRSFGFRFIIQGDFEIPSSREDVDRDSSWNQWLRSEIPQLFLHAMGVFTDHPEFSGLKGLCNFLQFVPLPDEVLDFFKPDLVIRDVIGGEELNRHLSLAYLHPGLLPAPPLSLLTHLGVRHLRGGDVTTVTTAMAKDLLQEDGLNSDSGLRRLARLLVCNFRALEQGYGETDSILTTLRDLPIIPLADGRMRGSVYGALYRDVCVVHPSLLSCVEPLESQQIRELLRRLGVHELEPQQLLQQHIYPALKNNTWKSKPVEVVVSYLVFIKQHSPPQEYAHPDTVVPVLTTRGLLYPADHKVHFSTQYGNMDLPNKLPGVDWVLLSGCYVETDGDVEGWRALFIRLGVRDGLILRKERRTLTAKELASSPWAVESELWPCRAGRAGGPEEGCVLDDYPSEELLSLVTAQLPAPVLMEQRQALLGLLGTNWDTGDRYSQYLKAQVIDSEGRPIKTTKSSFFHFLSCLPWVPAYRLQAGTGAGEGRKVEYLCPNSVYLFSPEVHSLLGTHVSYMDMTPSEFTRTLGMKNSVNVEELIGYLKKWCVKTCSAIGPEGQEKQEEEESEGSEFSSTVQHVHRVYSFLHKNCSQTSLKELFQHTPAVFIEYNRNGDWCSGRFYHLKEVCWSDPTEMFVRYRELTRGADSTIQEPRVLAPFYSQLEDMRDLFKRLNVEHTPSMLQYVGLLELVCNSCPLPTVDVLRDVSKLYARLADKCRTPVLGDQDHNVNVNPSYCSTLKGMLLDKRVFPTKDNSWVTLAHRPMIPDSKELEKIFKAHKQVCLLNLPLSEKKPAPRTKTGPSQGRSVSAGCFSEEDRILFLEICGVRFLSHCVSTEAQTENYRPCPSMQSLMENVICLLKDNKELYIQKDHLSARLDICRELVKLFSFESSHRKELVHFLSGLMTSLQDPAALKRFLQKECPGELPSEEEAWEVPQPVVPVQPIPVPVASPGPPVVSTPEDDSRPRQEDGEQTLMCWPPRASLSNTAASRTDRQQTAGPVEAVLKMWPPPAEPKDSPSHDPSSISNHSPRERDPEREMDAGREGVQSQSPRDGTAAHLLPPHRDHGHPSHLGTIEPSQDAAVEAEQNADRAVAGGESGGERPNTHRASQHAAGGPDQTSGHTQQHVFQGASQRPPLALDSPVWAKPQHPQALLEDLQLDCQRPSTGDTVAIGEWGEQLVFSFLCHWRDSQAPGGPILVTWYNQHRESGQPYDFKLTFNLTQEGEAREGEAGEGEEKEEKQEKKQGMVVREVFVEVKSTVKKDKAFIHLSANELDLALRERERYHVFRVYNAGDSEKFNSLICTETARTVAPVQACKQGPLLLVEVSRTEQTES